MIADDLDRALGDYRALHDRMTELVKRPEGDWRKRYVETRREMAEKLVTFGRITQSLENDSRRAAISREFRALFSKMRHTIALHQANWPVVAIDTGNNDYKASLKTVQIVRDEFLLVADRLLGDLRGAYR